GNVGFLAREGLELLLLSRSFFLGPRPRRVTGDRFNAPRPSRDGFFFHNPKWTDLTCRADVGPSAKFHRVSIKGMRCAANLQYTDNVAVFLAEKLNDVFSLFRFCERNLPPRNRRMLADFFVHQFFHIALLFWRERRA